MAPGSQLISACRSAFHELYGLGAINASWPHSFSEDGLALARRHRVMNLLEAGLGVSRLLDGEAAERWRQMVFGQARHTTARVNDAERLFARLEAGLQRPLLIKGPALAAQAWPDLSLRVFDDLDFRIGREEYNALLSVMSDAGYQPVTDCPRRRYALWYFGWGIGFNNAQGSIVEFNHRFFPPQYPLAPGLVPDRLDFATMIKLDEANVRTLTPPVHLLYACLHAAWHGWERLAWLVDIGGLMVKHPDALRAAFAMTAKSTFTRNSLVRGVSLASACLGLDVIETPFDRDTAGQTPEEFITPDTTGRHGAGLRHQHRTSMSLAEKAGYECRRIFMPGDGDFARIPLPRPLIMLHWILRPFRFAAQQLFR